MKTKVIVVIIVLLSAIISCNPNNKRIAQNTKPTIDSTFYITKNIALYDNVDSLLNIGILSYNTQYKGEIATDTCYNGVNFQEVQINYACENSKNIRNVAFAKYCSLNDIQNDFNKLANILNRKYGKPKSKKQREIHNNEAFATNFVYQTKDIMALLSSTAIYKDKGGTVILIFTVPQDSLYFKVYL